MSAAQEQDAIDIDISLAFHAFLVGTRNMRAGAGVCTKTGTLMATNCYHQQTTLRRFRLLKAWDQSGKVLKL